MRALLDVNVLIALMDDGHIQHLPAFTWLRSNLGAGWATCPVTQKGAIRILSQPSYPGGPRGSVAEVASRLADASLTKAHAFWPDDLNVLLPQTLHWDYLLSNRHLTDVCLLNLAVQRGGRLVTFDQRIPYQAVPGASPEHLCVISPSMH